MIKNNKKNIIITLIIMVIVLLIIPIVVKASDIIFPKVVQYNENVRELELEKTKNQKADFEVGEYIETEEFKENLKKMEQESKENERRILDIVEKYAIEDMNEIYNQLKKNGATIYDTNIELEYKFDNIILDILEKGNIKSDEKELLINYMYGELGNVKENQELHLRIENVCKKI